MGDDGLGLADGLRLSGLSLPQLWARYVGLGGSGTLQQLDAHVTATDCPDAHEHTVIAQALNEVFLEGGGDHPVAYRHS